MSYICRSILSLVAFYDYVYNYFTNSLDRTDLHTETSLLQRIINGEEAAFDVLFKDLFPALFVLANQLTRQEEQSKDIVSDVFLHLWENRTSLTTIKDINAYLYVSTRNRTLNYLKKQERYQLREEQGVFGELGDFSTDSFLQAIFDSETVRQLCRAIETLPPECKKVVELGLKGYSTGEIAEQLTVSASAVSQQKARAVKLLREKLAATLLVAYLFLLD